VDYYLLDCQYLTREVWNPLLHLFPLLQLLLNQTPLPTQSLQTACVSFCLFCLFFFRTFILLLIGCVFIQFFSLFVFRLLFSFANDLFFGHFEKIFDVSLFASQLFESFSNEALDDPEDFLVHDSDVVEVVKLVEKLFLELFVGVGSGGDHGCLFVSPCLR
jgi:hypothetical protein